MVRVLRKRGSVLGLSVIAVGLLLSACGGAGYGSSAAPPSAPAHAPAGTVVGTRSVPGIGTVLDDAKGLTLYYLPTDTSTKTTCTGGCAQVWPPLTGKPKAQGATVASKLGTIKRNVGTSQVTYAGRPLYTYTADQKPGDAVGNDISSFGATWYAVLPNGQYASD